MLEIATCIQAIEVMQPKAYSQLHTMRGACKYEIAVCRRLHKGWQDACDSGRGWG